MRGKERCFELQQRTPYCREVMRCRFELPLQVAYHKSTRQADGSVPMCRFLHDGKIYDSKQNTCVGRWKLRSGASAAKQQCTCRFIVPADNFGKPRQAPAVLLVSKAVDKTLKEAVARLSRLDTAAKYWRSSAHLLHPSPANLILGRLLNQFVEFFSLV